MKYAICLPFRANVDALFVSSLIGLVSYSTLWAQSRGGVGFHTSPRAQIAKVRSDIANAILRHNNEWSLWVDDDSTIPMNALELMVAEAVERNVNAVSAVCYERGTTMRSPGCYFTDARDEVNTDEERFIDSTGFHCVLVHSGLLRTMKNDYGEDFPLFQTPYVNGEMVGEDRFFWALARKTGILRLWQTRKVVAGHLMTVNLNTETRQHLLDARQADTPTPSS